MTSKNTDRAPSIWTDTVAVLSNTKHVDHPAPIESPKPQTKSQAPTEKEADRWVAQMMFENYNP